MNKIEPSPWRGVRALEKLILIALPVAALAVLILPFLDNVVLRRLARLPGARPIVTWLVNGYSSWIVGAILLLLFGLSLLWVRQRLITNRHLWFGTGCPECLERELVRVSRTKKDRLYGLIGVPAFRYACRNCTWRGLRIAHREYSAERIAELEASLMRFDPDGTPAAMPAVADDVVRAGTAAAMLDGDAGRIVDETGDIAITVEYPLTSETQDEGEDEAPSEEAIRQPDQDAVDAMEWLWRRSSET